MVLPRKAQNADDSMWLFFTMLFLVIDYARPQDVIPQLDIIRPAMLVIMILAYFIVVNRGISKSYSSQVRVIWYFILLMGIHTLFARNNYWAFQVTSTMLAYMPFVVSTVVVVNSVKRIKNLVMLYIVMMIYIACYSLIHGGRGSGNYFMDENDVSLFINMWLPFCFFLLLYDKSKWKRLIYLTGLVTGISAVIVSFSRGGFVGLICMGAVVWLYSPKKKVSLLVILLCVAALYLGVGEKYWQEIDTITDTKESTANERLMSWATAWDMFLDNPFGVGPGNFAVRFPEYQGNRFKHGMWGRVAHSLWFTLLPELGVLGVILYSKLLFYNLKDISYLKNINTVNNDDDDVKYIKAIAASLISSLAGYFSSASFISVLYYPHYWYLTALICALVNTVNNTLNYSDSTSSY
jgi:hypothetical protein